MKALYDMLAKDLANRHLSFDPKLTEMIMSKLKLSISVCVCVGGGSYHNSALELCSKSWIRVTAESDLTK